MPQGDINTQMSQGVNGHSTLKIIKNWNLDLKPINPGSIQLR
jgi:hypothetical protein